MATTAMPPPGAVPTNGSGDPFTSTPTHSQAPLRYAAFDSDQFSLYVTNSPSSAKRALEAHLRDTDRRIQDASRLGSTLVQQRKDLAARLQEVEQVDDNEIPDDLHKKLTDLEREYNEIGRESARAFLPKSRVVSEGGPDVSNSPAVLVTRSGESPTKLAAPSRRQRNQPGNRVHDIEFATEISTSLLAQVRQLQAALAEKDGALKDATANQAQLEAETTNLVQRIRHMDEIEQKYKDENWNLETRLQEIETQLKETVDKETRLGQTLKSTQSDTAAKERELDDLRAAHDRLNEEHAMAKKVQEADIHSLRRDAVTHETETQKLYRRIDELTTQNGELAKAVSYRWSQGALQSDTDFVSAEEGPNSDEQSPDHSPTASPMKGTPARHSVLESETLKSSLTHAHRMIQNLKNNIHREKTEKIELKRMLQDARDELETRRGDGGNTAANAIKKRRTEADSKFKKPARPDRLLGVSRAGTTEIIEDEPSWEDTEEDEQTPSKSRSFASSTTGERHVHSEDNETTDAFETADERNTTTESEAFQTGAEDFDDGSEGDLTETEGGVQRSGTVNGIGNQPRNRNSFMSTASTSADEEDEEYLKTPERNSQQPKYRLRLNRGTRRTGRVGDIATDDPSNLSPASSMGTPQPDQPMQSLGDELDALDEDSVEGTPVSIRTADMDMLDDTPATQRHLAADQESPSRFSRNSSPGLTEVDRRSVILQPEDAIFAPPPPLVLKPQMVDTGVMTEPWEPERIIEERIVERIVEKEIAPESPKETLRERAGDLIGGALAGFGLSRATAKKDGKRADELIPQDPDDDAEKALTSAAKPPGDGLLGAINDVTPPIISVPEAQSPRETAAAPEEPQRLDFSTVVSQDYEPITAPEAPAVPLVPKPSSDRLHDMFVAGEQQADTGHPIIHHDPEPEIQEPRSYQDAATETRDVPEIKASTRAPLGEISSNIVQAERPTTAISSTKPVAAKKPVIDEGSQTLVSGQDIDSMLRNKAASYTAGDRGVPPVQAAATGALAGAVAAAAISTSKSTRRSLDLNEAAPLRVPKRPGSAGSTRSRTAADAPPLPPDHTQKIAAAVQQRPVTPSLPTTGSMGPPLMPASAYKSPRPRTPADRALERGASREGTTPRPMRQRDSRGRGPSPAVGGSRRASVSSFASELDERFNINRGHIMYPNDVEPATDPRMIQAITQTMIGEFLWKYTRKAGRSETSNTRHRRFFWVHPYTRTLYWSEQDPSTAGRNMLKAKSVAIDAVRIITDDNAFPPGLHRKSLVVITPGREVVFTAPTGQRHETWFNALSYLLLRTEQEKNEAQDTFDENDAEDVNGGLVSRARRSLSKAAGRRRSSSRVSRASLSSYNSRTTRNSSPQRPEATTTTRADRRKSAPPRAQVNDGRAQKAHYDSGTIRASNARESNSVSARFSSIASRFRPSSRARSTTSGTGITGDPAQIYDASVVSDSAEDLRAVIEQQDRDADRLENVRACCDGKHDVGSLSRTGRHSSIGNRFSAHSLGHARPKS